MNPPESPESLMLFHQTMRRKISEASPGTESLQLAELALSNIERACEDTFKIRCPGPCVEARKIYSQLKRSLLSYATRKRGRLVRTRQFQTRNSGIKRFVHDWVRNSTLVMDLVAKAIDFLSIEWPLLQNTAIRVMGA